MDKGIPITRGEYLSTVKKEDLKCIFSGNIELPMLEERVQILNAVGEVLEEKYQGRFSNFVQSAPPRLYDQGKGVLEKLVAEFPRFEDVGSYDGYRVKFYKLAQLALWMLHSILGHNGPFHIEDTENFTAFADYILPVALRLMGIIQYSASLEAAINSHQIIPHNSKEEIEIRSHTIYATALLRREINRRRAIERRVLIPHIDARLWTHYHTTLWPHHLTRTIMY
jgi:hypothetical protein